jgi:hypothetical protein
MATADLRSLVQLSLADDLLDPNPIVTVHVLARDFLCREIDSLRCNLPYRAYLP